MHDEVSAPHQLGSGNPLQTGVVVVSVALVVVIVVVVAVVLLVVVLTVEVVAVDEVFVVSVVELTVEVVVVVVGGSKHKPGSVSPLISTSTPPVMIRLQMKN